MSKTILVTPDKHYTSIGSNEGGADKKAISCALQAVSIIKPDEYVDIGDFGEWDSVSPWQWKKKARPPRIYVTEKLHEEAATINEAMDVWDAELDSVGCKKRHFIEGNHEQWLNNFVEEYPEDQHFLPQNILRLKERGWQYYPYGLENGPQFGELNVYHGGHWAGINHTRAHVMNAGANVMYGHTHDQQTYKMPKLGSGLRGAWSIGCLADMHKGFLKGKPTNWSHNLAIIHLERGGKFNVEIVEIYEGVCWVYGQRIKG